MKQMPPHTATAGMKSYTGAFQRWRLLLTSFRKRKKMSEENSVVPPPFWMAAPSRSPASRLRSAVAAATKGRPPGAGRCSITDEQLGQGSGAGSWLGSFVGHGRKLVSDAAQPI